MAPSLRTVRIIFVRFGGQGFDGPRLGQVDVEPFRHHRRRDHEDDEQNQHDVDERRHVDFRHESFIAADRRSHEAPLLGLSASGHGPVGVQLALDAVEEHAGEVDEAGFEHAEASVDVL